VKKWTCTFLITLWSGIALGLAGSYLLLPRYAITHPPNMTAIKTDRWTGQTWLMRYYIDKESGSNVFYWDSLSAD